MCRKAVHTQQVRYYYLHDYGPGQSEDSSILDKNRRYSQIGALKCYSLLTYALKLLTHWCKDDMPYVCCWYITSLPKLVLCMALLHAK